MPRGGVDEDTISAAIRDKSVMVLYMVERGLPDGGYRGRCGGDPYTYVEAAESPELAWTDPELVPWIDNAPLNLYRVTVRVAIGCDSDWMRLARLADTSWWTESRKKCLQRPETRKQGAMVNGWWLIPYALMNYFATVELLATRQPGGPVVSLDPPQQKEMVLPHQRENFLRMYASSLAHEILDIPPHHQVDVPGYPLGWRVYVSALAVATMAGPEKAQQAFEEYVLQAALLAGRAPGDSFISRRWPGEVAWNERMELALEGMREYKRQQAEPRRDSISTMGLQLMEGEQAAAYVQELTRQGWRNIALVMQRGDEVQYIAEKRPEWQALPVQSLDDVTLKMFYPLTGHPIRFTGAFVVSAGTAEMGALLVAGPDAMAT